MWKRWPPWPLRLAARHPPRAARRRDGRHGWRSARRGGDRRRAARDGHGARDRPRGAPGDRGRGRNPGGRRGCAHPQRVAVGPRPVEPAHRDGRRGHLPPTAWATWPANTAAWASRCSACRLCWEPARSSRLRACQKWLGRTWTACLSAPRALWASSRAPRWRRTRSRRSATCARTGSPASSPGTTPSKRCMP